MTSSVSRGICAAIVLAVAACTGKGDAHSSATAVDTIAGVVYVRNPAETKLLTLRQIARIGDVNDGPASFGRARSVVADADGNIYVADSRASEVRVFDERGVHLRTFGRGGAGPAEFGVLASLAWLGDTLMVLDPGNARIGLLSRDGDWLGQIQHQNATGQVRLYQAGGDVYNVGFPRGGRLYIRYVGQTSPPDRTVFDSVKPGIWVDTLPYPRLEAQAANGTTIQCDHARSGMVYFFSLPDIQRPLQAPGPGGIIGIVNSDAFRITFVAPGGDTARVVERVSTPLRVTDDDWTKATAEYRAFSDTVRGVSCVPSSFTRPEVKTTIRDLAFDIDGRMWVEAATANGFVLDVFDSAGRQFGRAVAPQRQRTVPMYARGDRLYLVQTDSLDVQYVVVYAIER
jgi:hypothetical protein